MSWKSTFGQISFSCKRILNQGKPNSIVVLQADLGNDQSLFFSKNTIIDDSGLCEAIRAETDLLLEQGEEVYKHEKNVIATSKGYLLALYTRSITRVEEEG